MIREQDATVSQRGNAVSTDATSDPAADKETGRLEAFSDGVFAIAITLLILEIKVPQDARDGSTLLKALLALWPSYLAFLTSFATIGIMWINHHRMLLHVRRLDHALLVLNSLLLLAITFVPFPTAVLAQYLDKDTSGAATVAAFFYAGTFTVIAILFNLLWWHIAYWGHLANWNAPSRLIQKTTRAYLLGPLLYFVSLAIASFSASASFALTLLLAIFYALPSRL